MTVDISPLIKRSESEDSAASPRTSTTSVTLTHRPRSEQRRARRLAERTTPLAPHPQFAPQLPSPTATGTTYTSPEPPSPPSASERYPRRPGFGQDQQPNTAAHYHLSFSQGESSLLPAHMSQHQMAATASDPGPAFGTLTRTGSAGHSHASLHLQLAGTKRRGGSSPEEPPAKRQTKWSPEEDRLITVLRGQGMKWEDISKHLPGRSAISCRLHYQNYLERRCDWNEERKNKLARLYERFRAEMWTKVAVELGIPWRAAESMHWHLGEFDMARRAGVPPFSAGSQGEPGHRGAARIQSHALSRSNTHRPTTSRDYAGHSSPGSVDQPWPSRAAAGPRPDIGPPPTQRLPMAPGAPTRPEHAYESVHPDSSPRTLAPMGLSPSPRLGGVPPSTLPPLGSPVPGLPPLQCAPSARGPTTLPSLAELTTGVRPYTSSAYSVGSGSVGMATPGGSRHAGAFASPRHAGAFASPRHAAAFASPMHAGTFVSPRAGGFPSAGPAAGGYASVPRTPGLVSHEPSGLRGRPEIGVGLGLHDPRRRYQDAYSGSDEEEEEYEAHYGTGRERR